MAADQDIGYDYRGRVSRTGGHFGESVAEVRDWRLGGRGTRRLRHVPYGKRNQYHSPSGFNWGYEGSGPADLALAILTDAGAQLARELHQDFKRDVVAKLPNNAPWELSLETVTDWLTTRLVTRQGGVVDVEATVNGRND